MTIGSESHAWAVVPAAGAGRRFGGSRPKQYVAIAGRAVLEWSICALLEVPALKGVVVALAPDDLLWRSLPVARDRRVFVCTGGSERAESVAAALDHLLTLGATGDDRVLVHDAARPALRGSDVQRLLDATDGTDGGLLAVPVRDTLKRAGRHDRAVDTMARDGLWQAQTPQCFALGRLRAALTAAAAGGCAVTDEAQAMEMAGASPKLVEGAPDNIKLTRPADLPLLRALLASRHQPAVREEAPQ